MLHFKFRFRRFNLVNELEWLESERIVLGSMGRMTVVIDLLSEEQHELLNEPIKTTASHSFWRMRSYQLRMLKERIMYLVAVSRELDSQMLDTSSRSLGQQNPVHTPRVPKGDQ